MTALYPFTASTVSVLKSCLKSSSEQSSVLNLNESSVTLHSFRTIPLKFDGCPMLIPGMTAEAGSVRQVRFFASVFRGGRIPNTSQSSAPKSKLCKPNLEVPMRVPQCL